MSNQSHADFVLERLIDLVDQVTAREKLKGKADQTSYADMGWIKFYAKELKADCKCEEVPPGAKKLSE